MTIRASAADGSTRASWPVIPGRCSASAASSAAASAAGQAERDDAVVDQPRGAQRQRRLDHVMAAEDEVAELGQPRAGERLAGRDQAGRLRETGGDGRRAGQRRGRHRAAAADEPHADAAYRRSTGMLATTG